MNSGVLRKASAVIDDLPRSIPCNRPLMIGPNQRWSLDFVHVQMTHGPRFRILSVVDVELKKQAPVEATSISGTRVVRELDHIIAVRGRSKTIVSDNSTEG